MLTGERNIPFWERQDTTPGKGNDAVYGYFRHRKDSAIIFVTFQYFTTEVAEGTEFKSFLKRRWTQILAKGNNDKIKNYSF